MDQTMEKVKEKKRKAKRAPGNALRTRKAIARNWEYYMLLIPALLYVIIFCYVPMYGVQIAFKDFRGSLGISGSRWVGFKHFVDFVTGFNFWTLVKNTFSLSLYSLLVTFPIPIILALILNEVSPKLKRFAQTVLYAPHFISTVVLVGIMTVMFSKNSGVVNTVMEALGMERYYFMGEPDAFPHMYVWSSVWQNMGWNAIIYIAALSGVDQSLHEAAEMDGASRLQRIIHINLPCIMPTIIIMLIMAVGNIASLGFEKAYLLQNDLNVEVSEIISTYVYKRGLLSNSTINYSYTTAIGLFNNVINVVMLLVANTISRKVSETSLF